MENIKPGLLPFQPQGAIKTEMYRWFRVSLITFWVIFLLMFLLVIGIFIELTYTVVVLQPFAEILNESK